VLAPLPYWTTDGVNGSLSEETAVPADEGLVPAGAAPPLEEPDDDEHAAANTTAAIAAADRGARHNR
jgi:hypothetical protein